MVFSGIVQAIGRVSSMKKESDVKLWDGSVGEGYEETRADVDRDVSYGRVARQRTGQIRIGN